MSDAPKVEIAIGDLPPFWDRNVIFFSNLHSIFYGNVEGSKQLIQELSGAASYGGRVISILNLLCRRRPNLIFVEVEPDQNLMRYLSNGLGLTLPDYDILDHDGYNALPSRLQGNKPSETGPSITTLREHTAPWIDGFVTDATLVNIAEELRKQTICTFGGSKNGNNKYLLYCYQAEQKLPVFDTLLAANRDELSKCLHDLRRMGYAKAVVKAQIGASGYGMIQLPTENHQLDTVPEYLFFEGACMVQGWIDDEAGKVKKIGSPSVQMFLNEDTLYLFDLTEQILSQESIHEGNVSPPPYLREHPGLEDELLRQARMAGEWLYRQRYRGTASTDFLVIQRGESVETILCEINARITGATYPATLARHFKPRGAWYMRNIRFRKGLDGGNLIALMDYTGVLYRPGQVKGMIPFNFNTDEEGKVIKGQFVCIGDDREDCTNLLLQAWSQLPVEWGYDRD